jgi:rubrerythrin
MTTEGDRCQAGPMTGPEHPDDEGGDPACWARRVCPACGRLADEDPPIRCPACGAELPDD